MNLPNPAQGAFAGVLLQEHLSIELQRSRSENELNAVKEAFDHKVLTSGRYLRNSSAARNEFRGHGQAI
jgi:hypothetical protein